ncbi:MAG TPA: hypothetical protein VMF52_16980 [Steroidobacteraceae bacterium]|nr:hypothetical protein [Steroidobacteraceae bacterium]
MTSGIDTTNFQDADAIFGDDTEETELLRGMAQEARAYLEAFSWAKPIRRQRLALGVGGIVAVFYIELTEKLDDDSEALWIFVGDLPSAYVVVDADDSPLDALERYCDLMDDWAEAVLEGEPLEEVFPVDAAATEENARLLLVRTELLRCELISPSGDDGDSSLQ